MPIRQLPPSVVNKIAAGEVIERPASVVKELVENSLDSGATRIDVAVEEGGVQLVRVVDNGCGIAADELLLAVASHATSKLTDADDLFRVRTLGFRGEALASIAEVSRTLLRSRPGEETGAMQLEVDAGRISPITPAAGPVGTTIEVRDLFFNTPVRRKFLRGTSTEMGHVSEAFTRLALAHPHVHFTLRHNTRMVHELPPSADLLDRISLFFGRELADDLIAVESHDQQVRLAGYVARPSQSRSHPRMQYLFLNGRFIRDRALGHALSEAFRGLLLGGRYGICFLRIDMPPELVDVNVHPTKLEVRFQDGGRLYSQLLGTLRNKFLSTDLTHRLTPVGPAEPVGLTESQLDAKRRELAEWARAQTTGWRQDSVGGAGEGTGDSADPTGDRLRHAPLTTVRLSQPLGAPAAPIGATSRGDQTSDDVDSAAAFADSNEVSPATSLLDADAGPVRALQMHNRYLIVESGEGMVVIDQHALHERILYEQLREKVLAGAVETQRLLVPEPIDLASNEAAVVLEARDALQQVGIEVEAFGGDTVLMHSYPAMLRRLRPAELLRSLAEPLLAGGRTPDRRDVIDELLHMMSCKAAVKAGDPLTPEEVEALVAQRHLAQDSHHCPHGRPTALVFTREELDRQFKRT
ncbi:MAG: DNA mismatch repair endonuclease MutL [Planctomycetes bacterium]|nr:DNA mismatch repair endonuclease MutL [Planctomycetota bacterium]